MFLSPANLSEAQRLNFCHLLVMHAELHLILGFRPAEAGD